MIRKELQQWQQATQRLVAIIEEVRPDHREEAITHIEQLLNLRDQLQLAIQAPFTEEERQFGQELMQIETVFQTALQSFFKTIRADVQVTTSKRTHMKHYMNPYRHVQHDGAYYDTKQ